MRSISIRDIMESVNELKARVTMALMQEFFPICLAIYKGCEVESPEFGCFVQDVKPTDTLGAVWFESDYGYSFRVNVLNVKDVKITQRFAYGLDYA